MKRVTKHSENKSSVFAAIHKSLTLNRKGGCIMKKPIVYGSSLMSLLVILFAGIFMAAGCEKPIEPTIPNNSKSSTFPDTIDCSDYSLAPCDCNWNNIAAKNAYARQRCCFYGCKKLLQNSNAEQKNTVMAVLKKTKNKLYTLYVF